MYSIVMLTAFTAAPDAPQFNGYFRDAFRRDSTGCAGCYGCSGAARYSCSGGCYGQAAYPASCQGCAGCGGCGGNTFGLGLGSRVRSWFTRDTAGNGCCGGQAYACAGYSCAGTAFSCFGAPVSYTPVMSGGLGCQGGIPFSAPAPIFDPSNTPGVPTIPYAVPDPAPGLSGLRPAGHTAALTSNGTTARASVIVTLPEDAKLFVDGRPLKQTGAERKFMSPELPVDQEFVYRFRAEYDRDGETVSVTKKITVRGGETSAVEFVDLTAAKPAAPAAKPAVTTGLDKQPIPTVPTTQEPAKAEPRQEPATTPITPGGDRATITVKLPPGATLYVDDRKSPSVDPVRSFSTPPLPAGREFAYLLKAEVIRNGQPETLTQKVPFRAGERVVVDFTSLGK